MVKNNTSSDIAVIKSNILDIKDDVREIKSKLEMDYVTKEEFDPVKRLVFGVVGLILVGVVGTLIGLVLKK